MLLAAVDAGPSLLAPSTMYRSFSTPLQQTGVASWSARGMLLSGRFVEAPSPFRERPLRGGQANRLQSAVIVYDACFLASLERWHGDVTPMQAPPVPEATSYARPASLTRSIASSPASV